MTKARKRKMSKEAAALLDDPDLWRIFLSRITGIDVDHDHEIITSFAEAIEVEPVIVWLKLKPFLVLPTRTEH